jgi:hypothetical protein
MARAFVAALLLLPCFAPSAVAQTKKATPPDPRRWFALDSSAAWIDTVTIARAGDRVTMWAQAIVPNPYYGRKGMPKLAILVQRQVLDCAARTMRATHVTLRTAIGEVIRSETLDRPDEPVQPDTDGEQLLHHGCALTAKRASAR